MKWHFNVSSEEFGSETFGPYDDKEQAQAGIDRVRAKVAELNDGIEREFSDPYKVARIAIVITCPEPATPIDDIKTAARLLDSIIGGSIEDADVSISQE